MVDRHRPLDKPEPKCGVRIVIHGQTWTCSKPKDHIPADAHVAEVVWKTA